MVMGMVIQWQKWSVIWPMSQVRVLPIPPEVLMDWLDFGMFAIAAISFAVGWQYGNRAAWREALEMVERVERGEE